MKYEGIAITDPGIVRKDNEDLYYINFDTGTFAVCDGMGGAEAGEVASRIAIETIIENDVGSICSNLKETAIKASTRIDNERRRIGADAMGTTVALVSIKNDSMAALNVGDSRIYRLRDGSLEQLSEDHTLVYQVYLNGGLTKEELRTHQRSNELYQYLGMKESPSEIEPFIRRDIRLRSDDIFMLCTDGITDYISESRLQDILARKYDLKTSAHRLVEEALWAGGKDNITVILIKIVD